MENNEIMANEEIMEVTEEVAAGSGNGLKVIAGVGLAVVVGGIIYKYLVKPAIAKAKAKKELEAATYEVETHDVDETDDEDIEDQD